MKVHSGHILLAIAVLLLLALFGGVVASGFTVMVPDLTRLPRE